MLGVGESGSVPLPWVGVHSFSMCYNMGGGVGMGICCGLCGLDLGKVKRSKRFSLLSPFEPDSVASSQVAVSWFLQGGWVAPPPQLAPLGSGP